MRTRPANALSAVVLIGMLQLSLEAQAAESISFDFVADRPFPADAKKQREFAESFTFSASGIVVTVTGENEFGGAEQVSRRGPGGLGVRGNGDRNADGQGTTSGNRVNNGEHLIFHFAGADGAPRDVVLRGIVFDRIVRDGENFAGAGPTRYRLLVDGEPLPGGELESGAGPIVVSLVDSPPATTVRVTNDDPYHPIANRFRVSAITLSAPQ